MDHKIRQWVINNKLEDFNSLLNYTDEYFKPYGAGNLSYYKENGDSVLKMMSTTPLLMLENLRWYIQHLINESGYLYDDDESNYPLSEDKWMLQTHGKFMKYVLFTLHRMTPEQMKMNPIIKLKTNEELDTEKGESNTDEQESTISNKEEEEYSSFSDMSKQDSESDINVDDTQDEQNSHTSGTLQIHNIYNTTMHDKDDLIHDEYDTSEDENITETETFDHYGEKIHETEESTETSQVLTVLNKTIPHEDQSSDDKSEIEKRMGSKKLENRTNSLLPNFKWKLKTKKLKGS